MIVTAHVSDADQLAPLSQRVFIETFREDFQIPYSDQDLDNFFAKQHSVECYKNWVLAKDHEVLISKDQDDIQGFAVNGPCHLPHPDVDAKSGELLRIYVDRRYQGLGVGGKLLQASLDWLQENFSTLWVGVWSGNYRAQTIYEKQGFEKVAEYDYPVGDVVDREFIFRKN